MYIITLSGGTAHVPDTLGHSGHVIHESTAAALYFTERGVPPSHVLREWASYDTIGKKEFRSNFDRLSVIEIRVVGGL